MEMLLFPVMKTWTIHMWPRRRQIITHVRLSQEALGVIQKAQKLNWVKVMFSWSFTLVLCAQKLLMGLHSLVGIFTICCKFGWESRLKIHKHY